MSKQNKSNFKGRPTEFDDPAATNKIRNKNKKKGTGGIHPGDKFIFQLDWTRNYACVTLKPESKCAGHILRRSYLNCKLISVTP